MVADTEILACLKFMFVGQETVSGPIALKPDMVRCNLHRFGQQITFFSLYLVVLFKKIKFSFLLT